MVKAVFLDAGPLGLVTKRKGQSAEVDDCRAWMQGLIIAGIQVCVAEVTDYEIRRELIRAGALPGLARLDSLQALVEYLPITTDAMRKAADLWAQVRNLNLGTGDPKALDGDAIMAGQALTSGRDPAEIVIATTNVRHIARYVNAALWRDITP
jgi:predicted nucleic acid-binding protein